MNAIENFKVGDGLTVRLFSDQHAYTIIEIKGKTITIQRDTATQITKPVFIGTHCTNNNDIEYSYERNPNGMIQKVRFNKNNELKLVGIPSYTVFAGRHEFYDFNF